jgi:hypothetical protein
MPVSPIWSLVVLSYQRCINTIHLLFTKVPQYTFSRVRRQFDKTAESESGSGWSRESLEKFNAIADMVRKDWVLCGATFNSELYKVLKNTRKRKAKSNQGIDPKKQRPLIYDDMDNDDDSGQEDTNVHVSFVRVKISNVPLLSSSTATSELVQNGGRQRQHVHNSTHARFVVGTSECVNWR